MKYSYDIETTGLERTAKVIGFSFSDGTTSKYVSHLKWDGEKLIEVTPFHKCIEQLIFLSKQDLLMFNAQFDISRTKNYFGIDLTDALYADVMLQAHMHDENLQSYGLKQLAERYLGIKPDEQNDLKEALKKIGTKDFYKVDSSIMSKYAAKDAEITFKLHEFLKTSELFYNETMPTLKTVLIPMQARGVALNVDALKSDQANITKDIDALETEIQKDVAKYLTPFLDWFYEKNYPLKTRGKLVDLYKTLLDKDPNVTIRDAQKKMFILQGGTYEFNISSKDHLKKLFFDILKLTPLSRTEGGSPQVDSKFLESVNMDFAKKLIVYNKLCKIKSTYIDRFLEEQEDGIFYPAYFMHRTVSGRLSSDFQQLSRPIGDGSLVAKYNDNIRAYFIPRPGCVFIDNDYNSLEPRIFASLAGDQVLLDIFKNNHDFYSTIGISVYGLKDVSADKKSDKYLGKVNKAVRQNAKAFSLGIRYGMTDYKLHKDLNISQKEAEGIVNGYFKAFPKLKQAMEVTKNKILTTGQVSTKLGRIRHAPEIPALYKKHGPAVLNALELWKKYNEEAPNTIKYKAAKDDARAINNAVNNAYNHEIQGMAAHILNRASIAIAKAIKELGIRASIIASIHDELVIECHEDDRAVCAELMKRLMETSTVLDGVDLIADPSFGYNLRDAKGE